MKAYYFSFALFWLTFSTFAQEQNFFSYGLGGSFSYDVSYPYYWIDTPILPVSPHINLKLKRHELLVGPDIYLGSKIWEKTDQTRYPLVIGGQIGYRYHFSGSRKKSNFFLNFTLQYVQFVNQCLSCALPYTTDPTICNNWPLRSRTFKNTNGLGYEYRILKTFCIYSIVGPGINYSIINYYDGPPYEGGNKTNFVLTLRLGFLFRTE